MKKCSLCETILPDYYRLCPSKPNGVQCKGKLVRHKTATQAVKEVVEEKEEVGLFDPYAVGGDIDDIN